MGMLVTLYLMLINSHNSVEAPSSRGFSNVEVWFIGTQIPLAFGIIEYGGILSMRRFSKISDNKIHILGSYSFDCIKFMDVASFTVCSLYLLAFTTLYMFA